MYIGIAGNAGVFYTAPAWLRNGNVRPQTNSSMLRDSDVKSETGRANVARRALRTTLIL